MRGILLGAVSSSSGKTVLTAGIIRALSNSGDNILAVKVGPDYIDPQFLSLANKGQGCLNLDLWAMTESQAQFLLSQEQADFAIAEGVMGLFDGGKDGRGSSADVAALLGWAVVLVVDAGGQGETLAAVIQGLVSHRKDVKIAGVIFNRLKSQSHAEFLKSVMQKHIPDMPILGFVFDDESLQFESRHLGLKQALENSGDTDEKLSSAGKIIRSQIDLQKLKSLAQEKSGEAKPNDNIMPCNFQHIAIARDAAFSFIYYHHLQIWQRAGAKISFFSPLQDEAPDESAEIIFLPGGYPELHAKTLSGNHNFRDSMIKSAEDKFIYGECGGYMVMGDSITDFDGNKYDMLGFFGLRTSFAPPERHLGYRKAGLLQSHPYGQIGDKFTAHEFHHACITDYYHKNNSQSLWDASDSLGKPIGEVGHYEGSLSGSFLHIIAKRLT